MLKIGVLGSFYKFETGENMDINHTFVICAYKESRYLEECVQSLLAQTVKSQIILITSTPNRWIEQIVGKYHLEYYVNEGESGIVQDWNFGYSKAGTDFITLAHQDDVYEPAYTEKIMQNMKKSKHPLIAFCDYGEIRNNRKTLDVKMLKIKRLMLFPLRFVPFQKVKWVRRRILSLGDPICCPSVTFAKYHLQAPVFSVKFRADEDWQAWERLSRLKGSFIYVYEPLVYHRIHEESETSIIIGDNVRTKEDYEMFCMFWPKAIAKLLTRFYATSQKSNEVSEKE